MSVTIIIVTYNSEHLIVPLFSGLPEHASVIVVDNASSDETCARIESLGLSNLTLIRNGSNAGFGAANNIGLKQCRTRYALLLNPDAEISTDNLHHLIAALESHPTAVLAGPRILQPGKEAKLKHRLALYPLLHRHRRLFGARWRFWVRRSRKVRDFTQIYESGFLSGSILLYDLEKMPEVLYFDDDIFLYGDEDELEYRIISAGYRLLYVSYAFGYHLGQASTGTLDEAGKIWTREYYLGETLGILSVKYAEISPPFARRFYLFTLLLKQGWYRLLGKPHKAQGCKARRQGIRDGYAKAKNKSPSMR